MDLPVYELVISNEETSDVEVSFVALVDKPAIERNFLAFKNDRMTFSVNEEKRIISGPVMISGELIYRKDSQGEFNVFFSKETVRDIAIKFFKKDYQKNLNLFHDPAQSVDGVIIFESFVSDKERGINPMTGFDDLPDGTWFISAKVDNDEVWQKIKSGEVKGFSVEGIFSYLKRANGTSDVNSHLSTDKEKFIMSDIKDLWNAFKEKFLSSPEPAPEMPQFSEMTLKDGTKISVDKLEAGGIVMIGEAPAPAGDLELEDGTKVTIGEAGVITAVEAKQAEPEPEPATDYSQLFSAIEEKFSSYEGRVKTVEDAFSRQSEQMSKLIEIVEKVIDTPTANTVVGNNSQFSTQKTKDKQERIGELASLLKNLKQK